MISLGLCVDFRTALMLAAEKGNTALCDYLLHNGADVALVDLNGSSFFCYILAILNPSVIIPHRQKGEVLRSASFCVCLFVCLSVRISKKQHVQISPNFLYVLPVAVARSSSDRSATHYVLPVFFSMTSCFHIMNRRGQNQRRYLCFV